MRARLWQTRRYDWIAGAALVAAALAIRLPRLMLVPAYQDEGAEALWALDIARGHHLPLTGSDAYYGPFFSYLLAFLFRIFGPSVELPRVVAAVAGALTVAAVYWLALVMKNRTAALAASALALTSPRLVAFNSHYGWANSFVPLFATLTVATCYLGVVRQKDGLLVASGFLAALTLHAHPTSLVPLLGVLTWFLFRAGLRQPPARRAAVLAMASFMIGYLPVVVANLRVDSLMLREAHMRPYAFSPTADPHAYVVRLLALVRAMGSGLGGGLNPATAGPLIMCGLTVAAVLAGVVLSWRSGNRVIASAFIPTLALLPIIVRSTNQRYYSFVIPLSYVSAGLLAAGVSEYLRERSRVARLPVTIVKALAVLTVVVLAGYPLLTIAGYYSGLSEAHDTNAGYFRLAQMIRAGGACAPHLIIENPPSGPPLGPYPGFALRTIHSILALDACDHRMLDPEDIPRQFPDGSGESGLIIPEQDAEAYAGRFQLRHVATIAVPVFQSIVPIAYYRVQPGSPRRDGQR